MRRLSVIGGIWFLIGLIPAWKFPLNLVKSANNGALGGDGVSFWLWQVLNEATFLLLAAMGIGMMFNRRWAIQGGRIAAGITMAVAAWFILTQGFEHGPEPTYGLAFGFAFAAYTLFVTSKVGQLGRCQLVPTP